ncbi:hypothetical protein LQW54_002958 [Pestalotiopsis sp. IQ-011]
MNLIYERSRAIENGEMSTERTNIMAISTPYQGDEPTSSRLDLIQQFDELIDGKAHLDRIVCPTKNKSLGTRIWLSYWTPDTYAAWWASDPVKAFWDALPDEAGIWREILTVDTGRTQNAVTPELKNGVNGLDGVESFTEKIGY